MGIAAVSTSAVLIRLAAAPSLTLAFWRCALGAVALLPFALHARRGVGRGGRLAHGQRAMIAGSGVFLALHFAAYISSLSFTTVGSAAVLVGMSPLFVGIGAAVFLHERPSARTWIGIGVATAGAVVVAAADLGGGLGPRALLGDALAFSGAALVAGYLLLGRAQRRYLPVAVYACAVYAVAAAVLLPLCLLTGSDLAGFPARTWLAIAGLVAGPQLLGHTVFNALLSSVSATVVAVAVIAEPVGATLLALLVLGELPAPLFWVGAPIILAGVYVAATRGRRAAA